MDTRSPYKRCSILDEAETSTSDRSEAFNTNSAAITKYLDRKINDYWAATGKRPTAIYLGMNQLDDLAHIATTPYAVVGPSRRTEYAGIPVFVVDADDYIAVGGAL